MGKKINETGDVLRSYLNSDTSAEAPEGFTSRVMSRIIVETVPEPVKSYRRLSLVPAAGGIITLILTCMAIFLTGKDSILTFRTPDFIRNMSFALSKIDLPVMSVNLPDPFIYAIAAIMLLVLVDKGLSRIFGKV